MFYLCIYVVNLHLDGALHHYDTLHVNQISHTHSADSASRSHQITFVTLGLQFSMILKWNSHILAKDFSVYSMDKEGNRQLHDVDQNAFLHGHLESKLFYTCTDMLVDMQTGMLMCVYM